MTSRQSLQLQAILLAIAILCIFRGGYLLGHHDASPHHCQEDEVLAVKIDHDPSHGLTWECVNAEQYVATFYTQP